jgi:superfamily II DNA or RNA helicase
MVSEGVDIPRLRVGVYATTTSTELFFRQAVGRLVRWTRGVPRQRAWLFIPDDPRLRRHAAGVAEQRRHSLRRKEVEPRVEGEQEERELGDAEQMSLFAVLSAVATEASDPSGDFGDEPELDDGPNDEIELTLAPPPPLAGRTDEAGGTATLTRKEEKGALRDANAKVARELVRRTRMTHGQVNAELNRLSRVRKVSEATIDELERRLVAADRWLAKT